MLKLMGKKIFMLKFFAYLNLCLCNKSVFFENQPIFGSKTFYTLTVFLKEFLKKLILKKSADDNKTLKITQHSKTTRTAIMGNNIIYCFPLNEKIYIIFFFMLCNRLCNYKIL